jgi:hypothetical protein
MYANKSFARQSFSQSFAVTFDFFAVFPVRLKIQRKGSAWKNWFRVFFFDSSIRRNACATSV